MEKDLSTKKVAIYTLGCKTNQYESNAIIQEFIKSGYEVVNFDEEADVYIVNTCTVTNISDRKSRQILRKAKQNNKNAILVATGCYAQVAEKALEEIEEIDIIIGNNEKKDIVKFVENYRNDKEKSIKDIMKKTAYEEFGTTTYTEKTRAVIKIQDGCDNFCTYCIIPYARGRVRSRDIDNIIHEIEEIAKTGIKEVVLTGIHIASYGKDFENNIGLIDLLEKINEINGIERIRLGSLEPNIITDEFINRLVKLNKICHQFHLSLQSGCNSILERMNRKYTKEDIRKIAMKLRENFVDTILTADIIVGFPGETELEFEDTYQFLEEIKLYKIHVFKYSVRKGTRAEKFPNQVLPEIKEQRSKKVINLSARVQKEYNEMYIGKIVDVLVEEREDDKYIGHTSNYMLVEVENCKDDIHNKIIKVKIDCIDNDALVGKII